MPRCITQSNENKLVINDNLSGDRIALLYRMPTTQERIQYKANLVKIKGNKISKTQATVTRIAYGKKVITGFEESKIGADGVLEGGFTIMENGKEKPFASDPKSPNYVENWLELIEKTSADILDYLAFHVFESLQTAPVELEDDTQDEGGAVADLGE